MRIPLPVPRPHVPATGRCLQAPRSTGLLVRSAGPVVRGPWPVVRCGLCPLVSGRPAIFRPISPTGRRSRRGCGSGAARPDGHAPAPTCAAGDSGVSGVSIVPASPRRDGGGDAEPGELAGYRTSGGESAWSAVIAVQPDTVRAGITIRYRLSASVRRRPAGTVSGGGGTRRTAGQTARPGCPVS